MALTLEQLNAAPAAEAAALLEGVYEHSPWIAAEAMAQRPFRSLAHLKHAMAAVVRNAPHGSELVAKIHALGLARAKVLSGDEEANMGFTGALTMMNGELVRRACSTD